MMMTVRIIETGETAQLEDSYAARLIEQGKAVYVSGGTPEPTPVPPVDVLKIQDDLDAAQVVFSAIVKTGRFNPSMLQMIAQSGNADKIFSIGDEILIPWSDNSGSSPVAYDFPFVVADFRDCVDPDGNVHKRAMWLVAKKATPTTMLMIYDSKEYTSTLLGDIGNYAWGPSNIRQWLNSDAAKNAGWWQSQYEGDVEPAEAYNNLPGWMNGFSEEWKAIFKPVKVLTTCTGGEHNAITETVETYDTFFVPSVTELYGDGLMISPNLVEQGSAFAYFRQTDLLAAPSIVTVAGLNRDGLRMPIDDNTAGSCFVRSSCLLENGQAGYCTLSPTSTQALGAVDFDTDKVVRRKSQMIDRKYCANPCCVLY